MARGGHRFAAALHQPGAGRGRGLAGLRTVCGEGRAGRAARARGLGQPRRCRTPSVFWCKRPARRCRRGPPQPFLGNSGGHPVPPSSSRTHRSSSVSTRAHPSGPSPLLDSSTVRRVRPSPASEAKSLIFCVGAGAAPTTAFSNLFKAPLLGACVLVKSAAVSVRSPRDALNPRSQRWVSALSRTSLGGRSTKKSVRITSFENPTKGGNAMQADLGPEARGFEPILVLRHRGHRYHQNLPIPPPPNPLYTGGEQARACRKRHQGEGTPK